MRFRRVATLLLVVVGMLLLTTTSKAESAFDITAQMPQISESIGENQKVIKDVDEVKLKEYMSDVSYERGALTKDIPTSNSTKIVIEETEEATQPTEETEVTSVPTTEETVAETEPEETEVVQKAVKTYKSGDLAPKGELTFENVPVEEFVWDGPVINARIGTVKGPSGKETYYNLPMSGVLSLMEDKGYTGEYWVREDGAKMIGDFIMVAAELNSRPKGTIILTSLGWGVVCDTGGFAKSNPTQIDIAVAW